MSALVTILLVAAVLTVIGAILFVIGGSLKRLTRGSPRGPMATERDRRADTQAGRFGGLPSLSDPVGPLGNPTPGAELSSNADSTREIYGE